MNELNTPRQALKKSNQEELRSMAAAGDEIAICAVNMATSWPRAAVSRRELPAFANFFIGQKNITLACERKDGPEYCYLERGEAVYEKWSLALWLAKIGYQAWQADDTSHDNIPDAWFCSPEHFPCDPRLTNPYEVILHRKAEDKNVVAQHLVILSTHWDGQEVPLEKVGQFSDRLINAIDLMRLSDNQKIPLKLSATGALYDKWELMFWIYENIDKLPPKQFGYMREPDLARAILSGRRFMSRGDFPSWTSNSHADKPEYVPYTCDLLLGLGWSNNVIRSIFCKLDDIYKGISGKVESESADERVDAVWIMFLLFEKMNLLMGMDMVEAFRKLAREQFLFTDGGTWEMANWYDNLAVTVPRPLNIWSISGE